MISKKVITRGFVSILALVAIMVVALISGCSAAESSEAPTSGSSTISQVNFAEGGNEAGGEHVLGSEAGVGAGETGQGAGEAGEATGEASEGGEESGTRYGLNDTYDMVRKGSRLVMVYDAQKNAFVGAVGNITNSTLRQVRVEVHLSNGTELGPTTPVDLGPGEMVYVSLPATAQPFDGWTPHAEVGAGEHGGESGGGPGMGSESRGEHGSGGEGSGEHGFGGEGRGEHSFSSQGGSS